MLIVILDTFCKQWKGISFCPNVIKLIPKKSKPPVELVVCTSPKRAYYRRAPEGASNSPPIALLLQAAAKAAFFMPWYSCHP